MKRLFVVLIALSLLLTACAKKEPTEPPTTDVISPVEQPEPPEIENEVTEAPVEEPEVNPYTEISSLTGLPCTPEEKAVRPVAVVLNNLRDALPQASVGDADIVWECDMEGGITRLVAIYSDISKVGEIGAVRSARDYFVDIADMFGAILVHAGGSEYFYAEDKARGIDNVDEINMEGIPSGTFWRDSEKRYSRGYEHSLETSGTALKTAFDALGYDMQTDEPARVFDFYTETTVPDGRDATEVVINHSAYIAPKFVYTDGKYFKESYGEKHIDETTGEQLSFENLIVLFAKQRVVDDYLRLDVELTGEGDGIYITAGKAVDIKWTRSSKSDPFTLENKDGTPVMLNQGKTHITVFDNANKNGITIK